MPKSIRWNFEDDFLAWTGDLGQQMNMMEVKGKDIGLPWSLGIDKQTQAHPIVRQEGNIWKML